MPGFFLIFFWKGVQDAGLHELLIPHFTDDVHDSQTTAIAPGKPSNMEESFRPTSWKEAVGVNLPVEKDEYASLHSLYPSPNVF